MATIQLVRHLPLAVVCWLLLGTVGCFSPWFAGGNGLTSVAAKHNEVKEKLVAEDRPTIIAEIASPAMLTMSRLENIGLIAQLESTGGSVEASQQREKLLDEMRRKETDKPNTVLDDLSTAMVVASVDVPPAANKGDLVDVRVHLSSHANASDLRHGWLLETPLMEMSRFGNQVREGFERARVSGTVITQAQLSGDESEQAKLEGIIVGGGRLLKQRKLGISLDAEFASAVTMGAILKPINDRFTHFNGRMQTGIATPREESFVEVEIPSRYRLDPFHFINVVMQLSFNETETQRVERVNSLRNQLREPTTVRTACWQLEAIGEEGIPLLAEVLNDSDQEIRFYAAHSLAYLNDKRAIPVLVNLCLQEPAFRAMCFNGLIVMDHYEAGDALHELLHAADPEVKYGAALAIRERDPSDPDVTGEQFGDAGSILEIPSSGPPLVAASLSKTPEIVIYGENPVLHIPAFHYVNPRLIVSPNEKAGFTVSHFRPGEEDQIANTPRDLRSVLATISEVGGDYGDWISFVRECHENGYFVEPFAMHPVPQTGRVYQRVRDDQAEPGDALYEQTLLPTPPEEVSASETTGEGAAEAKDSRAWYNPLSWGGSSE